jgi:hypothetical protein
MTELERITKEAESVIAKSYQESKERTGEMNEEMMHMLLSKELFAKAEFLERKAKRVRAEACIHGGKPVCTIPKGDRVSRILKDLTGNLTDENKIAIKCILKVVQDQMISDQERMASEYSNK